MTIKTVLLAILSIGLGACGSFEFEPKSSGQSNQVVVLNERNGTKYFKSKLPSSIVAISQVDAKTLYSPGMIGNAFDVKVGNLSTVPVDFSASNITFSRGGKVMGADGARAYAQNMQTMVAIAGALGSGTPIGAAGFQLASQTTQQNADSFGSDTSTTYLTPVRIGPNQQTAGLVGVDALFASGPVEVTVVVGDDVHKFTFVPKK